MQTYSYCSKTGGRFVVCASRPLDRDNQREIEREICSALHQRGTQKGICNAPLD